MKTFYPYVEDDVLVQEVEQVLNVVYDSLKEIDDSLFSNVLDPFSAFFDAVTQNITYVDWLEQEKHRQLQKTLQNAIGYFHQNILANVKGWSTPGVGGGNDVENKRRKIFAEVKNKWNTFNSSSMDATYEKMSRFLNDSKNGFKGYVVMIVPKYPRRYEKRFVPGGKEPKDNLLEVDGATFYTLVTGDKNALKLLFEAIPKVIDFIRRNSKFKGNPADFIALYNKAYGI